MHNPNILPNKLKENRIEPKQKEIRRDNSENNIAERALSQ
jgi:hypothetical protein